MPLKLDLTNCRYGNLMAIEAIGSYKRESIWRCLCDCGKFTEVKVGNLHRGNTKSCGCMKGIKRD